MRLYTKEAIDDYIKRYNYHTAPDLVVHRYDGILLDNFILDFSNAYKEHNGEKYKYRWDYIIIKEVPTSTQSSAYTLQKTTKKDVVNNFIKSLGGEPL